MKLEPNAKYNDWMASQMEDDRVKALRGTSNSRSFAAKRSSTMSAGTSGASLSTKHFARLRNAFRRVDRDLAGSLTRTEISKALKMVGVRASPADVGHYLRINGFDSSNTLDFFEFSRAFVYFLKQAGIEPDMSDDGSAFEREDGNAAWWKHKRKFGEARRPKYVPVDSSDYDSEEEASRAVSVLKASTRRRSPKSRGRARSYSPRHSRSRRSPKNRRRSPQSRFGASVRRSRGHRGRQDSYRDSPSDLSDTSEESRRKPKRRSPKKKKATWKPLISEKQQRKINAVFRSHDKGSVGELAVEKVVRGLKDLGLKAITKSKVLRCMEDLEIDFFASLKQFTRIYEYFNEDASSGQSDSDLDSDHGSDRRGKRRKESSVEENSFRAATRLRPGIGARKSTTPVAFLK